jgi:YD repeat-containing protein
MVYTYDSLGFLRSVAQSGRVTTFEYNNRGLLARITDPLNRTASLSHDTVGRVTRQVLADGREILYAYDANGNLLSLTPPGKPSHNFAHTVVDLTHRYAPPELPPDSNWATDYLYNLDKQLTHTLLPGGDSIVVRYDTTGCGCSSMPRPAEIDLTPKR